MNMNGLASEIFLNFDINGSLNQLYRNQIRSHCWVRGTAAGCNHKDVALIARSVVLVVVVVAAAAAATTTAFVIISKTD